VSLLADPEDFIHDYRPHGPLIADATEACVDWLPALGGCPCGVVFERWVTPEDADADLLGLARLN
jgi:hypothetical protein